MKNTSQKGFLHIIIIVVIALIILGYFGMNIQEILAKPVVHDNLVYFWNLLKSLWTNVLAAPARWLWDHILALIIKGAGGAI